VDGLQLRVEPSTAAQQVPSTNSVWVSRWHLARHPHRQGDAVSL